MWIARLGRCQSFRLARLWTLPFRVCMPCRQYFAVHLCLSKIWIKARYLTQPMVLWPCIRRNKRCCKKFARNQISMWIIIALCFRSNICSQAASASPTFRYTYFPEPVIHRGSTLNQITILFCLKLNSTTLISGVASCSCSSHANVDISVSPPTSLLTRATTSTTS